MYLFNIRAGTVLDREQRIGRRTSRKQIAQLLRDTVRPNNYRTSDAVRLACAYLAQLVLARGDNALAAQSRYDIWVMDKFAGSIEANPAIRTVGKRPDLIHRTLYTEAEARIFSHRYTAHSRFPPYIAIMRKS